MTNDYSMTVQKTRKLVLKLIEFESIDKLSGICMGDKYLVSKHN